MIIRIKITGALLYVTDSPLANIALPEAVAQRCCVKRVFLETSQNPQEKACARVSFLIKLKASRQQLY